jgi:hypothetical protein
LLDAEFHAKPRFVTHIEDGAITVVAQTYRDCRRAEQCSI